MATIKDVARIAGVSTTTVSHVINKTRFVAESTQGRVNAAVKELNYAPSAVARSLKCNSTRTIGMLVTQSTNPFFAEVVDGVESYCYRQGYTLILCNTGGIYEKQRDYIRMLAEKRVDGIFVMCSDLTEELQEMLDAHANIPKVVMDWGQDESKSREVTDKIIDNSEEGGYLATKYLIENGHSNIVCLSGHLDKSLCIERIDGYKRALAEHGISYDPTKVFEGNFECDTAVEVADRILAMADRPSAVFCFNDIMALGLMSRLQQKGVRVPEDMSIIGYDNIDLAAYFSPPLTTIHQPKRRVGKTAFEILLERIKNKEHERRVFEMHPELIVRQSVKAINS